VVWSLLSGFWLYCEGILGKSSSPDWGVALATLFAGSSVIYLARQQGRLDRRRTALQMHEKFFSLEFRQKVQLPVWKMALKWEHLPEPERKWFRDAVVNSYLNPEERHKGDKNFIKLIDHFNDRSDLPFLTENQAFWAFLTFFVTLDGYVKNKIVDAAVVRDMFKPTYSGYYGRLIESFRKEVEERRPSANRLPGDEWMEALKHLEHEVFAERSLFEKIIGL